MNESSKASAGADVRVPRVLHPFAKPAARAGSFINIVSGSGAVVVDEAGKQYIDGLASLWYCNVGHGRGEIADAVRSQMGTLEAFHLFDKFTNPMAEALAERLSASAPMDDVRVFFTTGGSESVESAIKMARLAHYQAGQPERTVVVSRTPSYHGVSYGAMSATGLPPNQTGFGQLLPDIIQVPYDDLEAIDALIAEQGDRIAAIIAEPVVGAGGVYPPPEGYFAGLRERCDRTGAFLILDEVICGFGRLGTRWAAEHYGVRPDMVTFAKGITSGYIPLGGVLVGPAVHEKMAADPSLVFRHGHTYSGHPTACAAGMATLDIMEKEGLFSRAEQVGPILHKALSALVDGQRVVEVRGDGAVWALGLGAGLDAMAVRDAMVRRGVIVRPIGADTLAFCPPLVISDAQLQRCAEVAKEAVDEAGAAS